jgi:hypothetical protein
MIYNREPESSFTEHVVGRSFDRVQLPSTDKIPFTHRHGLEIYLSADSEELCEGRRRHKNQSCFRSVVTSELFPAHRGLHAGADNSCRATGACDLIGRALRSPFIDLRAHLPPASRRKAHLYLNCSNATPCRFRSPTTCRPIASCGRMVGSGSLPETDCDAIERLRRKWIIAELYLYTAVDHLAEVNDSDLNTSSPRRLTVVSREISEQADCRC